MSGGDEKLIYRFLANQAINPLDFSGLQISQQFDNANCRCQNVAKAANAVNQAVSRRFDNANDRCQNSAKAANAVNYAATAVVKPLRKRQTL